MKAAPIPLPVSAYRKSATFTTSHNRSVYSSDGKPTHGVGASHCLPRARSPKSRKRQKKVYTPKLTTTYSSTSHNIAPEF